MGSITGWRWITRFAAFPFDDELTPEPTVTWWDYFQEHRNTAMPPQARSWTCSICATDWLIRATGLNPYSTREQVAVQIGYPSCVDEWSGLKDTQCIVNTLSDYGVEARQEWVSWDRALELAATTAVILNSTSWYHFVGCRGLVDEWTGLWIANSAIGYKGIAETINAAQWASLPGWQAVYLVH
jgi:hypothetical protein